MLYGNKARDLLYEAASAEFLDPEVSPEVKDTVQDIQDILSTDGNIETVDADEKRTNGVDLSPEGVEMTSESCPIYRIGKSTYGVDIRDIMRICEAAADDEGEPADAADVAADVADQNNVDASDLVIVAPADVAEEIIEACLYEAKCGKKGKAAKKANKMKKALSELKDKGFNIVKGKKK